MDGDNSQVVLASATSALSVALHPLPILNISEHFTRDRLQSGQDTPTVLGVLLGSQSGREIEIVNSFELPVVTPQTIDHEFLLSRKDQYKQVFPATEFIGWYTVATTPTEVHLALQEQFVVYSSTPLLLLLQPKTSGAQTLPIKIYEPTVEIRDRRSRSAFVDVPYSIETGEAERTAVHFTGTGNDQSTSLSAHLNSQRSAVQMLHDRIGVLLRYVESVKQGTQPRNHRVLRAISSLVASIPASENRAFREEFNSEFADVQLTSYLATLTAATSTLNELVDKHIVHTSNKSDDRGGMGGPRRRGMGMDMRMGLRGHDMMERYM